MRRPTLTCSLIIYRAFPESEAIRDHAYPWTDPGRNATCPANGGVIILLPRHFGVTMAGISSKALNGIMENKKKFISQMLDDEFGLNWYQFRYRNHDPQIGRFWQIDPISSKYVYNSTYAYAENKVGMGFDLEGLELQGSIQCYVTVESMLNKQTNEPRRPWIIFIKKRNL